MTQTRVFPALCLCCALLTAPTTSTAETTTLYVSLEGSDGWSGRLPEPAPDLTDGPFVTPERARDEIRSIKTANGGLLPGPVEVQFRGAKYPIPVPLVLTSEDSGTETTPITYRSYPGERAVLTGGRRVAGWLPEGGLWFTTVPAAVTGDWWFTAIVVNGELRPPARDPQWTDDPRDPDGDGFFNTAGLVEGETEAFRFQPGDLQDYENTDDVFVMAMHAWDTSYHRFSEIDHTESIVRFHDVYTPTPGSDYYPFENWGPGQRYCVYHAREALDEPGEWWMDSVSSKLYYYPKAGEDMSTLEVVVPILEQVVVFQGEEGGEVEHIAFTDLAFCHTGYRMGPRFPREDFHGLPNTLGTNLLPAAIEMTGTQNCTIEDCEFAHLSAYAVHLRTNNTNTVVRHNHIHDLGAGAVAIGFQLDESNTYSTIDNNWVHDGGKLFPGVTAIRLDRTSHNEITHNEISDFYYSGISAGNSLNYDPSTAHDNLIAYNHIHHIGRGLLSDMGAIYTNGVSPGTVIRNNYCHDVFNYEAGYGGWGIYLDEGSSNIEVRDNIVHSVNSAGFHLHYGRENLVENNIFAYGFIRQIERTRLEPLAYASLNIQRNIFFFNNHQLFAGQWDDLKFSFDYNCYWFLSPTDYVFPGGNFSNWQGFGMDIHGMVADPGFADPESYDFSLAPDSPAVTQLGFQPIDVSEAGLYGEGEWINAPLALAHEPTPLPLAPEDVQYYFDFEDTVPGLPPEGFIAEGATDGASVEVTNLLAADGVQSLLFQDAPGLPEFWNPHVYLLPNYRFGYAVARFWLRRTQDAVVLHEWRDWTDGGYVIGPHFYLDHAGLFVNGNLVTTPPQDDWFFLQIACQLGAGADDTFDLTLWRQGDGWETHPGLDALNTGLSTVGWIGLLAVGDSDNQIHLDNFTFYTTDTLTADSDNDGVPDWLDGVQDTDGDGTPNYLDPDADGDGTPDGQEFFSDWEHDDPDNDALPNYLDPDSDNDGYDDRQELFAGTDPYDEFDFVPLPLFSFPFVLIVAVVLSGSWIVCAKRRRIAGAVLKPR